MIFPRYTIESRRTASARTCRQIRTEYAVREEGRYHTDHLSNIPRTFVFRYCSYVVGKILIDREEQARRHRRYIGGDGDRGAVLSESLPLWSHIVGSRG